MKTSGKYVVFYCDQCELLEGVVERMMELFPSVEVRLSSDVDSLIGEMSVNLPVMVVVYMTINDESYISVVKRIREVGDANETPVFIYRKLPEESDLRTLWSRM